QNRKGTGCLIHALCLETFEGSRKDAFRVLRIVEDTDAKYSTKEIETAFTMLQTQLMLRKRKTLRGNRSSFPANESRRGYTEVLHASTCDSRAFEFELNAKPTATISPRFRFKDIDVSFRIFEACRPE
ncbi:hypothetical protein HN011_009817, partial [Eciton burchellii]